MKKYLTLLYLTLLFSAMPLIAWAWGSAENEYRVIFTDGKVAEPVYTKSYTNNFKEEKLLDWKSTPIKWVKYCSFYFNEPAWLNKNMETIEKCDVKEHLSCYEKKELGIWSDGFVCFKDVDKIEQIK